LSNPLKRLNKLLKNLKKMKKTKKKKLVKSRNKLFYLFLMKSLSKQNPLRRLKLKMPALSSLNYSPRVMEI